MTYIRFIVNARTGHHRNVFAACFLCCFVLATGLCVQGQSAVVVPLDSAATSYANKMVVSERSNFKDLQRSASKTINTMILNGHWMATFTIDSTIDGNAIISLEAGAKFQWSSLVLDEQSQWVLSKIRQNPVEQDDPIGWIDDVLNYYENHGYPFASLSFDSMSVQGGELIANLTIDRGPAIGLDSIAIKGYSAIKRPLLKYQLGLALGKPYSEQTIRDASRRIDRVEHIAFTRPPQVLFSDDKTTLYLYVEEEKNNAFSGIAGLNNLPEGGFTITGEADIRLLNSIKQGEDFRLQWRRPGVEMQMLDVALSIPFPFHLPIGLDGKLNLFRQDSSFFNLESELGAQIFVNQDWRVRLFYESRLSSVLSQDEIPIAGVGGFSSRYLQLGIHWDNTNHFLLPTKGIRFTANGGNGIRRSEGTSTSQWIGEANLRLYQPLFGRIGLFARSQLATIYGGELLANEVYRVGGINTMRGFNEQGLFASTYAIQNIEFRYALDRFSFIQVLADVGYFENTSAHLSGQNWLFAIGAGMSFQTDAGILNLVYAVGKTNDQPFDFPAANIHIGYISRF